MKYKNSNLSLPNKKLYKKNSVLHVGGGGVIDSPRAMKNLLHGFERRMAQWYLNNKIAIQNFKFSSWTMPAGREIPRGDARGWHSRVLERREEKERGRCCGLDLGGSAFPKRRCFFKQFQWIFNFRKIQILFKNPEDPYCYRFSWITY